MKRKPLILVASLIVLFIIATPYFGASYDDVAISAEPNTRKDFTLSDDWNDAGNVTFGIDTPGWLEAGTASFEMDTYPYGIDTSNQSIEGFVETLEDDVLHYPDAFAYDGDLILSDAGDAGETPVGDYEDTHIVDGVLYEGQESGGYGAIVLTFKIGSGGSVWDNIVGVSYSIYCKSSDGNSDVAFWRSDTDNWGAVEDNCGSSSLVWVNGSLSDPDYFSYSFTYGEWVVLRLADDSPADVAIDYAQITLQYEYITGTGYTEPFSDVSDWTPSPGNTPTSDGDIMNWVVPDDGGYDWLYTNQPSLDAGCYLEFRAKANHSVGTSVLAVRYYTGDTLSGTGAIAKSYYPNTAWATYKIFLVNSVESVAITCQDAVNNVSISFDYLRISPADEMGWSHDGSTTEGIDVGGGASVTTTGDLLNITNDAGGASAEYCEIVFDTTATASCGSFTYYPFFEVSVSSLNDGGVSDGNVYYIRLYDSVGAYVTVQDYNDDTGVFRYNLAALAPIDFKKIRIYVSRPDDWVCFDWFGLYGIANYTITQSGTSTDDVLYCEDGVLICSGTSFTSITLDRDPALSLEWPFYGWGLNSSSGTPQVDFYNASGYWVGYSSESEGQFPYASTITDVRFKFTDSANIISLTFFDATGWRYSGMSDIMIRIKSWFLFVTVIIYFTIELFTGSFDAFLILIGLILIPASVLYLAKGGKDEMSFDKVAIFSIVMFLGIGLFVGGIMP